jgi:hypothetical protein
LSIKGADGTFIGTFDEYIRAQSHASSASPNGPSEDEPKDKETNMTTFVSSPLQVKAHSGRSSLGRTPSVGVHPVRCVLAISKDTIIAGASASYQNISS